MSETIYNLLKPSDISWWENTVIGLSSQNIQIKSAWAKPIVNHHKLLEIFSPGKTYTISYKERIDRLPNKGSLSEHRSGLYLYCVSDSSKNIGVYCNFNTYTTIGEEAVSITTVKIPDPIPENYVLLGYTIIYDDNGKKYYGDVTISDLMIVEGSEPAAWAPSAEEEISVGGGGAMIEFKNWITSQPGDDLVIENKSLTSGGHMDYYFNVSLDPAFKSITTEENTKFHVSVSLKTTDDCTIQTNKLWCWISYKDSSGNGNFANSPRFVSSAQAVGNKWTRLETTITVPSGMSLTGFCPLSIYGPYENLSLYAHNAVLYPVYNEKKMVDARDSKSFSTVKDGATGPQGPKGDTGATGYSIVANVTRTSFTEGEWTLYGTDGHTENWSNTENIRNNCRIGDIFTVTGNATDTENGHTLFYQSTTDSGTLRGKCIGHVIAKKGATGPQGPQGLKGENGVDLSNGKMLFTDPYFAFSKNSCWSYNNLNNGNVKIERVGISSDNPFSATSVTSYELKIINTGTSTPSCGGFEWGHASRANAIFIYRIIAKIPTGRRLYWASNATGSGSSTKWLTSNVGTGKFTEYLFKLTCGDTGTFSGTGYFYIDGSIGTTDNPIEWRVAYATCFDMTSGSDVTTALSTAAGKNKTVYSENADPSATTGYVSGDTWFNKATGGIWQFDGKAWKLHQVGTVSISNGAVTADKIAAGSITAEKLSASSVSLGNLDSSLITSNLLPDSVNNIDCWLPNPGVSGDGTMNDFLMEHTGEDTWFYDCDDHKSTINFLGVGGDWECIYYKISGLNRNEYIREDSRTYTLSFEFRNTDRPITLLSSKTYIPFGVFGYGIYDQQDIHSVSKDWNTGNLATIQVSPSIDDKRYSVTFSTYYNTIYLAFNFGYIADQFDCYFSFGKFKLEVGSEATPWETPKGLYLDKDEMHINADAITSGTVNAVDILGSHISGGTIVGNTIQGNTISGGTVSGTKITGGTISGTDITGSTIRTQYKNDLGWLGPTKWQKTTLGNDSGLRFDYRSSSSQPDINTSGTHYATLGYDGGKSVTVYAKDVNSSPYVGLVIHSGIIDEYLTDCVRIACTGWGTSCAFSGGHGTHFLVLVDNNFYTVWENSTNNIVVRHRINNAPSVDSSSGSVTTDNIRFSRQPNDSRWLYVTKTNGVNSSITIIG